MRNVSRVCVLILIVTIFTPIFGCVYALNDDAETTLQVQYDTDKAQILNLLNITNESFYESTVISRIDFLKCICAIMGESDINDVDAFKMAVDKKLTAAETYADFRANDNITGYEAITMLVSALGRGTIASLSGGYPAGYANEGKRYGLTLKKSGIEDLTIGDAVSILHRVLYDNVTTISTYLSNGSVTYGESDETLIYHYRKLLYHKGIMTGNDFTSLNDPNGSGDNRIIIDDSYYKIKIDYDYYIDLLGYPVIAYINDSDEVVAISRVEETKYNEVEITDDMNIEIDNQILNLNYYNGNKQVRIKLSPTLDVIFNGKADPNYTVNTLKPLNGTLKLIDNDNDNTYDVAIVKDYDLFFVDYSSSKTKMIYNQYDKVEPIYYDLNDDNIKYIITYNGEKMPIGHLEKGDIIQATCSKTGNQIVIIGCVSKDKIEGTITLVNTEELKVNLDDGEGIKEYKLNSKFVNEITAASNRIQVGVKIVGYLDNFGKIAAIDYKQEEFYAYIIKLRYLRKEDIIKARYLDSSNQWKDGVFADKVRVNGSSMKDEEAFDALGGSDFAEKVARIRVNEDGKIRAITTPNGILSGDDKFVESKVLTDYWYQQNFSFSWNMYLSSNATVFLVPASGSGDEDEYMATTPGGLRGGTSYKARIFNANDFDVSDIAVVYDTPSATNTTSGWFVVTKKVTVLEDEEVTTRIYSEMGNDETETCIGRTPEILANVNVGDVIVFDTDLKHRIKFEPTKLYDSQIGPVKQAATNYHGDMITTKGFVVKVDALNNKIKMDVGSFVTYSIPEKCTFKIYDEEKEKLTKGTIYDLKPGDYIIFNYYYSDLSSMIVIRPN